VIRGSPIQLARIGSRFVEVYAADDDRSFTDALLIGQRIYARDLVTGDSLRVFQDTTVASLARWYALEHPDDRQLQPEEELPANPHVDVTGEMLLLDQHGPYLSYEYRLDGVIETTREIHEVTRGVVDVAGGRPASLSSIFGDTAAARITRDGEARLSQTVDSVISSHDKRAPAAVLALGEFSFDPRSFTLAAIGRSPAVQFAVIAHGPRAAGAVLTLEPIRAPEPAWWKPVATSLPVSPIDSGIAVWRHSGLRLEARYDTVSGRALIVIKREQSPGEWIVARVPSPARRVYWLDELERDSVGINALRRAFDEAALYSDEVRTASSGPRTRERLAHRAMLVSHKPAPVRRAKSSRTRTPLST
jgi:hypothetical protein